MFLERKNKNKGLLGSLPGSERQKEESGDYFGVTYRIRVFK